MSKRLGHAQLVEIAIKLRKQGRLPTQIIGVLVNEFGALRKEVLTDIVEVTQVQPLDGAVTPVAVRIKQLRTLKAGWLDGAGKPPSDTSLDWLEQLLGQLPSDGSLPRPYLYPTPEGSVQAEWDIGPWSVTAEVDALNRRLAVSALNTQTQASHDYDIQAEHAEELVNFLKFLKTEPPSQLA